jgi:hypothetical protein
MNDHHDIAWPSLSTIQAKTGLARSTVVKYIDILCDKGWLVRDLNSRSSTTYIAVFPKPIQDGLKVLSTSTPDELANMASSSRDELGSTRDELALVRETNPNKQSNKQANNINDCFAVFWENWKHCKKSIGLGSNYGSRKDALAKWKKTFIKKTDIEKETDLIVDRMIEIYSDIADSQQNQTNSVFFNYVNMYPQAFIDNALDYVMENESC